MIRSAWFLVIGFLAWLLVFSCTGMAHADEYPLPAEASMRLLIENPIPEDVSEPFTYMPVWLVETKEVCRMDMMKDGTVLAYARGAYLATATCQEYQQEIQRITQIFVGHVAHPFSVWECWWVDPCSDGA